MMKREKDSLEKFHKGDYRYFERDIHIGIYRERQ